MIELTRLDEWRDHAERVRRGGRRIGLVPTMGSLHAGHRRLFEAAREAGDWVVATVFVNPRQFNDPADLAAYPRDLDADRALAAKAGVDCLVVPTLKEMWPERATADVTLVHVPGVSERWEGEQRTGHFDGVASVVTKLFVVNGPGRAYFGEKDFQQVAVVRSLVRDLGFDIEVVAVPSVRDDDGLALSSRNARLSPEGRRRALAIPLALATAANSLDVASALRRDVLASLRDAELDVAYVGVVDSHSLEPCGDEVSGPARLLVAVTCEGVRLIDNGPVTLKGRLACSSPLT